MIEFHIDLSLNVLHDLTDDPATSNLCVKIISNIARQSNQLKDLVLNKTFSKLEETSILKGCPNNNSINNRKRLENFIQDANLSLLTSLAEFLLPVTDNPNPEINYLKLTRFWELIQNGLVHSNSLTRKRALYLLKRATDTASLKRLNVDTCHLYNVRATCWTNFFLCIEMMEETSVHIIKPCLPIVSESLVPAVVQTGELHFTWVLVLLSRAFLHESKFIVRWAMRTFLQSGLKIETDLDYEFMNRFLLGPFMGVLQKGFLYQKAEDNLFDDKCPKIAGLVADFFGQYVGGMPTEMMKIKFLTGMTLVG